jgi:broad specificity phosphatase PhoE
VVRLAVLARHAQSTLNLERRINGDPLLPVELTADGEREARALGEQVAGVEIDLCLHSRFDRARRTAELALARRGVPMRIEPLLDDIDVGDLEGETIAAYRTWKHEHPRSDPFPGGESLDDAARRYAEALRRLRGVPEATVLVVAHEIFVRYAVNGATGSDDLDRPVHDIRNATPYLFDAAGLERAATRIDELTSAATRP